MRFLGIPFALLLSLPAPERRAPGRVCWEPARRLSTDSAPSLLTYNFARSIAADGFGRVHAVWYVAHGGGSQVYTKRSTDHGVTWEKEVRLSESAEPDEHPAVAVSGQNVYVVWHGTRAGHSFDVFFKRSIDSGLTWQPALALSGTHKAAHASIAASGSSVHVVWGDSQTGNAEIHTRRSADSGSTWEEESRLTELPYESWVPTVAVSEEVVLVAWVDYRDGNEEEYLKRSSDGGESWGPDTRLTNDAADSWAPSLAISGEEAYMVWFDRRDACVTDLEVEKALDDILALLGLPFAPAPARDPAIYYLPGFMQRVQEKRRRIQDAASGWLAGGGDRLRFESALREFEDRMNGWSSGWEIYFARSVDRGRSWSPDRRLTHAPGVSARPSIAAAGKDLHVVWFDGRDDNFEVYTKRSSDGGLTWSRDVRVTDAAGDSAHPTVAASGGFVHILWHDTGGGNAEITYTRGPSDRAPRGACVFLRPPD